MTKRKTSLDDMEEVIVKAKQIEVTESDVSVPESIGMAQMLQELGISPAVAEEEERKAKELLEEFQSPDICMAPDPQRPPVVTQRPPSNHRIPVRVKLSDLGTDEALETALREIIVVPKGSKDMPTLMEYTQKGTGLTRSVFVDMSSDKLSEAWRVFKEARPDKDPEAFIVMVYRILCWPLPRVFRAVGKIRLE